MAMGFGGYESEFNRYNEIDAAIARLQSIKVAIMQACDRIENASSDLYGQQLKIINDAIDDIRREVRKI